MTTTGLHPSLRQSLFVTGTDTGVGKTTVTIALMRMLVATGRRVAGMKPVAAGAELTSHGWRNDDALDLAAAGNVPLPYEWINPVCLPRPTSPHLAALDAGVEIEIGAISAAFDLIRPKSDLVLVEGAGGWLAPVSSGNPCRTMQDVALALGLPVVMVVGVRLGCLNHAMLTEAAIARSGLPLVGWIANPVDPHFPDADRYVASLVEELAAPLLWRAPRVILPGQ
jgi:dethiobiotin synthetase